MQQMLKNFYQNDECGIRKCPSGATMQAESTTSTTVINHRTSLDDLNDENYKNHIHRYMEAINRSEILDSISSTLKYSKENE